MRVKLISALCGEDFAAQSGDELDLPEAEALRMCVKGLAKPADKEAEALLAKKREATLAELKEGRKAANRKRQHAVGMQMLREQATAKPELETAAAD